MITIFKLNSKNFSCVIFFFILSKNKCAIFCQNTNVQHITKESILLLGHNKLNAFTKYRKKNLFNFAKCLFSQKKFGFIPCYCLELFHCFIEIDCLKKFQINFSGWRRSGGQLWRPPSSLTRTTFKFSTFPCFSTFLTFSMFLTILTFVTFSVEHSDQVLEVIPKAKSSSTKTSWNLNER